MAEALVNARLGERWQAYSAGTHPVGYVHPHALYVLAEVGIKYEGRSKSITDLPVQDFDLVITVCDSAAEECPLWLGKAKRMHYSFPDPAKTEGSLEEVQAAFRSVRDAIAGQILPAL
jgi:arsenate reductase